MKKGFKYPSSKQKALNIATSGQYEKAEYIRFEKDISHLEEKWKQIKAKEEESRSNLEEDDSQSPSKLFTKTQSRK